MSKLMFNKNILCSQSFKLNFVPQHALSHINLVYRKNNTFLFLPILLDMNNFFNNVSFLLILFLGIVLFIFYKKNYFEFNSNFYKTFRFFRMTLKYHPPVEYYTISLKIWNLYRPYSTKIIIFSIIIYLIRFILQFFFSHVNYVSFILQLLLIVPFLLLNLWWIFRIMNTYFWLNLKLQDLNMFYSHEQNIIFYKQNRMYINYYIFYAYFVWYFVGKIILFILSCLVKIYINSTMLFFWGFIPNILFQEELTNFGSFIIKLFKSLKKIFIAHLVK